MLRNRDVITDLNFSTPEFKVKKFRIPEPDLHQIVSKLSEIYPGRFIPDPDLDFLPIPDPGVKKAPDPGSATRVLIKRKTGYYLPTVRYSGSGNG
jgi:hypothetical protein